MRRLIEKYGVKGYGLYNYILECIAFNLEPKKPIPEIEESAGDLAKDLKMDTLEVEEIIKFCIDEQLFEINPDNKRIMCLKILNHLDNTLSNNPEIKMILNNFKKLEETSINLKQIRLDKNRLDKTREDKKFIPPTLEEIRAYVKENKYNTDPDTFFNYFTTGNWIDSKGNKVKNWKQKIITWSSREKKPEPTFQPIITNVTSERKQRENNELS